MPAGLVLPLAVRDAAADADADGDALIRCSATAAAPDANADAADSNAGNAESNTAAAGPDANAADADASDADFLCFSPLLKGSPQSSPQLAAQLSVNF